MSISFVYPEEKAKYEAFQNVEELRDLLRKEKAEKKHYKNDYRVDVANEGAYAYVRCRNCKARMSFKWCGEQELYKLNTFNNVHDHKYEFDREQQYMDWLEKLPLNMELATAKNIAVQNFHVSASKFYHTYQRIRRTAATFSQLIAILQRKDYQILMDPYPVEAGHLPSVLVMASPQMKMNMKLYGQTVCYDLTYNVISQISEQGRQYAVGIFTGVNCYNHIIPLGISILCEQTASSFTQVFDTFITINGQPQSFITDEQNAIASAIIKLQNNGSFSGTHLLDAFHVIRNFAKMSNRQDLMGEVRDIIVEPNPENFKMRMENLRGKLRKQQQLKAFQLFAKKVQMVCFSQLPHGSFVIFNCSTSINEKMNDMLKMRVRKRKPYTQTLKIIAQFCEILIESSQKSVDLYDFRIQEVFNDYDLQVCRYLLAQRPMKELIHQYVASFHLKQPFSKGDQYNFKETFESHQCLYGKQMICTCGYHEKTGIPCKHMILICRQKKRSYIQFTHPRWRFDEKKSVLKIEKYRSKRKE